MRLLLLIAAALAAFPEAGGPAPACLPQGEGHAQICGLAPRPEADGFEVVTVTGERIPVALPASGVVAVPIIPLRVPAELTTASPSEAADRYCEGFPACQPVAVGAKRVPEPLVRWDDASGSIRDLEITTVDLGSWTLVLRHPDVRRAERVARGLDLRVGADGFPRLTSASTAPLDAGMASVTLWVPAGQGGHEPVEVAPR